MVALCCAVGLPVPSAIVVLFLTVRQTDRQTDTHITVLRSPKHEHFARIYPISRRFKIGLCLRPQNIGVCNLFVSHYQTVNAVFVVEVHGLRQRLTYNGTTGLLLILFSSVLAFLD